MFLSSLLHSGEALKTGSKIAVVGWLSKPLAASPEAKIKPSVAKGSKAREKVALHGKQEASGRDSGSTLDT